jgi:hypothetical protein
MRRRALIFPVTTAIALPAALAGQTFYLTKTTVVAPGVIHRQMLSHQGPWSVNVVAVDLRQAGIDVRAARAANSLRGRETVSSIVRRLSSDTSRVVAAINADFFNLKTGEDENNQIIDGEIWKGRRTTGAPQAGQHHVHSQFAVGQGGRPLIDTFAIDAKVLRDHGPPISLGGVNDLLDGQTATLYTPRFGAATPPDTADRTVEIRLRPVDVHGDTSSFQVAGPPMHGGGSALGGASILSLPMADTAGNLPQPGELIRIAMTVPRATIPVRTLVGGWPRLIVHGRSIADSVDRLEGTQPSFSAVRHPRTGVGFSRDSTRLYLITVDGRQESSSGMSLVEFARLMLKLGVYEGLNLDGGGSTAMVVNGRLVNHPSDPAGERTVGNALLVVQNRRG